MFLRLKRVSSVNAESADCKQHQCHHEISIQQTLSQSHSTDSSIPIVTRSKKPVREIHAVRALLELNSLAMAIEDTKQLEADASFLTSFILLIVAYSLILILTSIQLIRIFFRLRNLAWSTQRLFLALSGVMSLMRVVFFTLMLALPSMYPPPISDGDPTDRLPELAFAILRDLPTVVFFTTYLMLILFWAEIVHHTRGDGLFTRRLRPAAIAINLVVYLIQIALWVLLLVFPLHSIALNQADDFYRGFLFLAAACGFVAYGGRLFSMLKDVPTPSEMPRVRKRKLVEVGAVTVICTVCFSARAILLVITAFIDVLSVSPPFLCGYYLISEFVPSVLVLFLLRQLPPARRSDEDERLLARGPRVSSV